MSLVWVIVFTMVRKVHAWHVNGGKLVRYDHYIPMVLIWLQARLPTPMRKSTNISMLPCARCQHTKRIRLGSTGGTPITHVLATRRLTCSCYTECGRSAIYLRRPPAPPKPLLPDERAPRAPPLVLPPERPPVCIQLWLLFPPGALPSGFVPRSWHRGIWRSAALALNLRPQ